MGTVESASCYQDIATNAFCLILCHFITSHPVCNQINMYNLLNFLLLYQIPVCMCPQGYNGTECIMSTLSCLLLPFLVNDSFFLVMLHVYACY